MQPKADQGLWSSLFPLKRKTQGALRVKLETHLVSTLAASEQLARWNKNEKSPFLSEKTYYRGWDGPSLCDQLWSVKLTPLTPSGWGPSPSKVLHLPTNNASASIQPFHSILGAGAASCSRHKHHYFKFPYADNFHGKDKNNLTRFSQEPHNSTSLGAAGNENSAWQTPAQNPQAPKSAAFIDRRTLNSAPSNIIHLSRSFLCSGSSQHPSLSANSVPSRRWRLQPFTSQGLFIFSSQHTSVPSEAQHNSRQSINQHNMCFT